MNATADEFDTETGGVPTADGDEIEPENAFGLPELWAILNPLHILYFALGVITLQQRGTVQSSIAAIGMGQPIVDSVTVMLSIGGLIAYMVIGGGLIVTIISLLRGAATGSQELGGMAMIGVFVYGVSAILVYFLPYNLPAVALGIIVAGGIVQVFTVGALLFGAVFTASTTR